MLVGVYGKWGLLGLNLFELRDGHVTRRTNLFAEIERLLDSSFPRSKVEPYNVILIRKRARSKLLTVCVRLIAARGNDGEAMMLLRQP